MNLEQPINDCKLCQAVIRLWNKNPKSKQDIKDLVSNVPEVFALHRTKWHEPTRQLLYTLACKTCGNTVIIPATN